MNPASCFISFQQDISAIELPELFTFPFYYQAHPLVEVAAQQLQQYLNTQQDWKHNFGLNETMKGMIIGKMFGVLVVRNTKNELGFLAAYSGKLANSNEHAYFVPPVFDILKTDGFYKKEERHLSEINHKIELLERNPKFLALQQQHMLDQEKAQLELQAGKHFLNRQKKERKIKREYGSKTLSEEEFSLFNETLRQESLEQQYKFKKLKSNWQKRLEEDEQKLAHYLQQIEQLKKERKKRSQELQKRIFDHYRFLNAKGEYKSLLAIFTEEMGIVPPAGAGECAAPKLLHYAYQHELEPIALGEFWWGRSPKSEIRKHKEFYPSCRSKCEPILNFMLEGLSVEPNPMLQNLSEGKELEIVYEDDVLLLVNKPAEFLSVDGKMINDSVQSRMQQRYPEAVLVHRLDQSTSGLLLVAKNKDSYQYLQQQFIKRTVKKRYVALLDGLLKQESGEIHLPLRVDLDNRPHQLVCYEYGKPAHTRYEVIEATEKHTRVYFYPVTGRTHQLRVHAAHPSGLNTAIVGDDLYGKKADRLYLHAEYIAFKHPVSKQLVEFEVQASF